MKELSNVSLFILALVLAFWLPWIALGVKDINNELISLNSNLVELIDLNK